MQYTIFDMPVIRTLMRWISLFVFRIRGWRIEGRFPAVAKYVLIAAPHTSNWDFPITLCMTFALKGKIYWLGKDTLFRWPFGVMFKWLGGIPVDRSKSNNMVAQMIQRFSADENLVVTIPPAGTRSNVMKWKTGFYYIALGAKVPVVLGFLNYRTKVGGIGPVYHPSGDIHADMQQIRSFYSGIHGKHPVQDIYVMPPSVPLMTVVEGFSLQGMDTTG
jgi:1-acyl-sn-glycerol-3-phosphate acyltransferase